MFRLTLVLTFLLSVAARAADPAHVRIEEGALVIVDRASGQTVRMWRGPDRRPERVQTFAASGRLVSQEWREGGAWVVERFTPLHRLIRHVPLGPDRYEVTYDAFLPDGRVVRSGRRAHASDLYGLRCDLHEPVPGYEALMSDLSWLALYGDDGTSVSLGSNIVARGCQNYGGSLGGVRLLAAEAQEALHTGLSCLREHGRGGDAARLLGLFAGPAQHVEAYFRPFTIRCVNVENGPVPGSFLRPGALGMARIGDGEGAPGFEFNSGCTSEDCSSPLERKKTLFHEMLHLLGYAHGTEYDLPYLAENCCFPPPEGGDARMREAATLSCHLMRTHSDWRTPEYVRPFARIMTLSGRDGQGSTAAWMAGLAGPYLPEPNQNFRDMSGLFEAALEIGTNRPPGVTPVQWRDEVEHNGHPFKAMILAQAAIEGTPYDERAALRTRYSQQLAEVYYPLNGANRRAFEAKREIAAWVGRFIGARSTAGGAAKVTASWNQPDTQATLRRACRSLSERERRQLERAIEETVQSALENPVAYEEMIPAVMRACD